MASSTSERSGDDVVQLARAVWRVRLPLDGHNIGHVNVYVLRGASSYVLIDSGWKQAHGLERLVDLLHVISVDIRDVSHLLLTHGHGDHCGLAGELQQATSATVVMHAADAAVLGSRFVDQDQLRVATEEWIELSAASEDARQTSIAQIDTYRKQFAPLEPDVLVESGWEFSDGDLRLSAIHTPGHTPGHLCFREEARGLLFTGDAVMPRINYSATYRPLGCEDPLAAHRASLHRLLDVASRLGLPGHQEEFHDPARRIRALLDHQEKRSSELLQLMGDRARTAWQLSSDTQRRLPWHELAPTSQLSAIGETLAHLIRLRNAGEVTLDQDTKRWSRARPASGSGIRPTFGSNTGTLR